MRRSVRIASDYNRGLAGPIRLLHVVTAAAGAALAGPWRWFLHPGRRDWVVPLATGLVLILFLQPLDGPLTAWLRGMELAPDIRRELHAWQQFGALGSMLFTAAVIWLLDPARRRRLLDLAVATGATWLVMAGMKLVVGRPRPRLEGADPAVFLGPWGQYPVRLPNGTLELAYTWSEPVRSTADLWSMPSSHTGHAAVLAVFLTCLYPRLRALAIGLVAVVGFSRVAFGAHWPTDVVAGAALGWALGQIAVGRYWGVRGLDWAWARLVDVQAGPALPRVLEVERLRLAGLAAGPSGGPDGGRKAD